MLALRRYAFALCLVPFALSAQASTFWAARGATESLNGTTIVAYMRDDLAGEQNFVTINDEGSIAFKGLFVGKTHRFEAGLNARGLFVGQISAASVSRDTRLSLFPKRFKSNEGWRGGEWLIRNCASVSEALNKTNVFSGYPMIYVLADKHEIAFVECLPNGHFHIQRTTAGLLTHTNHYVLPESTKSNGKVPASSISRLARIDSLLETELKPFRLEQFLSMTQDEHAGPDLSLFRVGSKPRSPKTTGIWLLSFPSGAGALSYLRYLNEDTWVNARERFPARKDESSIQALKPEALTTPLAAPAEGVEIPVEPVKE